MARQPAKAPDRHYDFRSMNQVFAWSSLALLAVTLWMVFDDYAKPWKRLQAEFRDLERQSLAREAQEERQLLDAARLAEVEEEIRAEEERLAGQREEVGELEAQIRALDKKIYAADATMRGTKSLLDTARYRWERVLAEGDPEDVEETAAEVERLRVAFREERIALETLREERDSVAERIAERRAGVADAESRLADLRAEVTGLEQRIATLDKSLDYFLLNAPLVDFVQPPIKVEQVILPGLHQDLHFAEVERVDRCMTCHLASDRPGFDGEEWSHPFRSHPRLDLFLGAASPHPYARYGCTTCHGGLDRATDFARAGHSPVDEAQKERWIEEWGWEEQKYLETPILPADLSEAGCVSCHAGEVWTPASERQDVGRELITRMGCSGCHQIDYPAFRDAPRPGPDLRRVASKTEPGWAYRWIEAPREFRPTTWMPHFFFQANIEEGENEERQRAEIAGIVAYLWDASQEMEYPEAPAGDPARGREHFESLGCTGCHILDGEAKRDDFFPQINRLHGPNLVRTGSKVDRDWLYAWLKDPRRYAPETRMPQLRLTDGEAADLTAYLSASRDEAFEGLAVPDVEPEVRDDLVLSYLQASETIERSEAILAEMSDGERDVYLGRQTIQKYGCYACHQIAGFEDAKPIGVELTEEGSKPLHQFDFGNVHEVAHTRHDWIRTKLLRPRIWDHGKERVKGYDELLKMPNFGMSEREAKAVLATVLGFTEESASADKRAGGDARTAAVAAGRKLISKYNCQGCHLVEGEGHAIASSIEDVGMLPPNLAAEGARVQGDWLFEYLHDPGAVTLRPWLDVRMPTFQFTDEEANTIVSYFAARDEREPFLSSPERPDERELGVGAVVFDMLQCARCHPAGPAAAEALGVNAAELAPSLLLGPDRLRHDWVPAWIKDPQSWVSGTNMPSNFNQLADGTYQSPLVQAIDAPMFAGQKSRMMRHFDSEDELEAYLADVDNVTVALRDHIWWNLARR